MDYSAPHIYLTKNMPSEKISFDYSKPAILKLNISGDWQLSSGLPSLSEVISELNSHNDITEISLTLSQDFKWDSAFVSFVLKLSEHAKDKNISLALDTLPAQIGKLINLISKQTEKIIPVEAKKESLIDRIGSRVIAVKDTVISVLNFLGDILISFQRLLRGKVFFRRDDFLVIVQKCGADAFALVSLITILVGMILAFIGAIQLKMFGAQIYIADIVGIAMVRVMGAVMTAVLVSGRTGASFAAVAGNYAV